MLVDVYALDPDSREWLFAGTVNGRDEEEMLGAKCRKHGAASVCTVPHIPPAPVAAGVR